MRLTVRGRLTLVYGSLFLAFGVVMLGVTYVLVWQQLPGKAVIRGATNLGPVPADPTLPKPEAYFQEVVRETRDDALTVLLTQGGIALLVVSAVAIALGWLVAGRMLQPLHRITETARRIAESPAADRGLHERIALTGPDDEIKQLADTFDLMLTRLDRSFDGQRRFIANASHELRTPLTLNRTLLEVALQQESASVEVRQLGTTLLAINDRHGRLIDGLLTLARSERELTERSYVDLADIASHVSADDVQVDLAEAATVGDPVLLERLVQNLVDNSVRHNLADGGWVRVATYTKDDLATLEVSNTGPVVPRYEVETLFEPFRRLGRDRLAGPGVGLGLSIVRAVARAHGGEVHAVPRDEGGLVVTVTLPAARPWQ
ncbi:sensor histidine kinase [Amorphoplanes digitatis]|uniref:sensor histidine kinase n=1 Tax=Actinoplanes digitatis TaxID=1868 RepID=UPI00161D9E16|nr:HAMP domain-containing sensor histidine kinase [Actinoplanes digitatis]GID97906.1 sensor protein CutS [Actinoplanes digitatis]